MPLQILSNGKFILAESSTLDFLLNISRDNIKGDISVEKYGFIYIWYDRKRKMYYLGSHWGTENDGYICSSNRMRDAYRRRPHDFKRRIIQQSIKRVDLLNEEYKWLQLISDDELGKKYYNLRKHKWNHWSIDEEKRIKISKKISKPMSEETKQKLRIAAKKQFSDPNNRAKHSEITKSMWNKEEYRTQIINTKTGKRYGPKNGQEYSIAWKKEMGLIKKCRVGKGGKYKRVEINNVIYNSIQEAAKHNDIHNSTVTQWIKKGKAKLV